MNMLLRIIFLFALMPLLFVNAYSQTGPGGVGDNTSNVMWLESDNISGLSDDDDVTTWLDRSGNNNDVTQSNVSYKPIYKTNIINGFPVVRFSRANGRIIKNNFTDFPTSAITEIYVNANGENNDGVLSYASTTNNNDFLLFSSSSLKIYRANNSRNSGVALNDNNWHIVNASWKSSGGVSEVWKDGNRDYTNSGMKTGVSIASGGCLAIAGEQDAVNANYDASQSHTGDFTEVIIYNTFLNLAQQIIVSNYLSAKYNISISNDYFSFQATHSYDVAGIGREDASNTHIAAMSADILQIENPSTLDADNEYLLFGHDNSDATTNWTTNEAPEGGTDIQRIEREWRLDETGDLGTIDFIVDVSNMPVQPAGYTMYALMLDADGDFSNGAKVYEMSLISGTKYTVTGVNFTDGDYVSIATVNPKIQHTLTASNDFEPNNAVIEVSLNFIPRTDRTVDYTTADGLATGTDYTSETASTLTITAGNQIANYTISITNDVLVENDEDFTISLTNPSAGISIGTNSIHTYTINDDDNARKIQFSAASSNGDEASSPVVISVSINNVDNSNATTVDYSISGGSATGGGVDYTLASGTLTIASSSTANTFNISINDDLIDENNETIIITLSNPTNCNLDNSGNINHTYTINDNDNPPNIQFSSISSSGIEASSPISYQVTLNTISGIDASVDYTVTGSASGSGVDYSLANGTVTIGAGNLTENITATIIDDIIDELEETIIITLSSPTNASLGTNTVYTYTITDNDNFGYTGPGGVGDLDNNKLWVKADDLSVVADGTDISTWIDASGNSNDLSQSNASYKPRYYNNVVNGVSVARFNQSNNRLIHNNFNDFPSNSISTIIINKTSDSGDGIFSYASSANNNDYLWFNSSGERIYMPSNINTGVAINGNIWRINMNTWQKSDGSLRFYRNGTQDFSGTKGAGRSITQGGCLAIAAEQDAINGGYVAGESHQGDIAEIILYNIVLNSSRRKIINNYLSAKYGIAIANDMYDYDVPNTFEHEVFGIGKDDTQNFHLDAKGTNIVRINKPSSLNNGDYLFCGHDNASTVIPNTVDVPAGIQNRLERIWRADETGNIGSISVSFDVSDFIIGDNTDLVLLIDSDDGLFVNSTEYPISSFSANTAVFDNINLNKGAWFTIASKTSNNILPIELLNFTANIDNDNVLLNWETASEINNDYFIVEKSNDGINFIQVNIVDGQGTSNKIRHYNSIDHNPFKGISYYRLKQIDFNEKFTYSNTIKIKFDGSNSKIELRVYPNPIIEKQNLTIELNHVEKNQNIIVNISNIHGEIVYSKTHTIEEKGTYIKTIRTNNLLSKGIYIIVININDKLISRKIIIE